MPGPKSPTLVSSTPPLDTSRCPFRSPLLSVFFSLTFCAFSPHSCLRRSLCPSPVQCRERFMNVLNPEVRTGEAWTETEDAALEQLVLQHTQQASCAGYPSGSLQNPFSPRLCQSLGVVVGPCTLALVFWWAGAWAAGVGGWDAVARFWTPPSHPCFRTHFLNLLGGRDSAPQAPCSVACQRAFSFLAWPGLAWPCSAPPADIGCREPPSRLQSKCLGIHKIPRNHKTNVPISWHAPIPPGWETSPLGRYLLCDRPPASGCGPLYRRARNPLTSLACGHVQTTGKVKWSKVAAGLPGRTDRACAFRWGALHPEWR
jgi:hypothetical protein